MFILSYFFNNKENNDKDFYLRHWPKCMPFFILLPKALFLT